MSADRQLLVFSDDLVDRLVNYVRVTETVPRDDAE